jgi:hypothetical protein
MITSYGFIGAQLYKKKLILNLKNIGFYIKNSRLKNKSTAI